MRSGCLCERLFVCYVSMVFSVWVDVGVFCGVLFYCMFLGFAGEVLTNWVGCGQLVWCGSCDVLPGELILCGGCVGELVATCNNITDIRAFREAESAVVGAYERGECPQARLPLCVYCWGMFC